MNGETIAPRALDALAHLHTRTTDTLSGFQVMVDKAEPEFRPVAEQFQSVHDRHARQLTETLIRHGRQPDLDGSFMSGVNRVVVNLRAFFDEIDDDVMDQVRNGERHVIDAFDEALKEDLPDAERQEVAAMKAELTGLIDETRHLD